MAETKEESAGPPRQTARVQLHKRPKLKQRVPRCHGRPQNVRFHFPNRGVQKKPHACSLQQATKHIKVVFNLMSLVKYEALVTPGLLTKPLGTGLQCIMLNLNVLMFNLYSNQWDSSICHRGGSAPTEISIDLLRANTEIEMLHKTHRTRLITPSRKRIDCTYLLHFIHITFS